MGTTVETDNLFHHTHTQDTDVEPSNLEERLPDKTESETSPQSPLDGGRQAWLTVLGGACVYFSTLGYANSFGVFQQYYETHQLRANSPDDIAWIGSLANYLQFGIGVITGAMFDRRGPTIIYPAAVLHVFAFMMVSLCRTYWQFMLAQGVLLGLTQGAMVVPATAAVMQHFHSRRGLALGLTVAGSSLGGIVLPIALSTMLNGSSSAGLSFGWSVRVLGFVLVPPMAVACLTIRPHPQHHGPSSPFQDKKPPGFPIREALHNRTYTLGVASMFIVLLGLYTPVYYLPSFAVSRGLTGPTLASYLLAVFNGASTLGRVLPGVLADSLGHLNVYAAACIATGVATLCWGRVASTAGVIVFTAALGFASGAVLAAAAAGFALSLRRTDGEGGYDGDEKMESERERQTGAYMGAAMGVASLAALVGPPVNGVLLRTYGGGGEDGHGGGFGSLAIFSGTACIVGGAVGFARKATLREGLLGRV